MGGFKGEFPAVFQHGDAGRWNLLAAPDGSTSFIDWEAAEPVGMPLWDLFYFVRSFAVGVAVAAGEHRRLSGIRRVLFERSPLSARLAGWVALYCRATGLSAELVEPLFHTCWMHRALKEATRLDPGALHTGHYRRLLTLGIEQRRAPGLADMFAAGREVSPLPLARELA